MISPFRERVSAIADKSSGRGSIIEVATKRTIRGPDRTGKRICDFFLALGKIAYQGGDECGKAQPGTPEHLPAEPRLAGRVEIRICRAGRLTHTLPRHPHAAAGSIPFVVHDRTGRVGRRFAPKQSGHRPCGVWINDEGRDC